MSHHEADEAYRGSAPGDRDRSTRLLRAIEELRALERQKHAASASDEPFEDLARRLELKAREVFEMAAEEQAGASQPDDEADAPRPRH